MVVGYGRQSRGLDASRAIAPGVSGAGTGGRPVHAQVLDLQRRAGNRAVASLVGSVRRRTLQRFTEAGHKAIGDFAFELEWAKQDLELAPGLTLTFGDAVAMGDYFGSFHRMQTLAAKKGKGPGTRGQVLYVLWAHIWGKDPKQKLGDWYDAYAMQVAETESNWLTGTNISHFPNPETGDVTRPTLEKATRRDSSGTPVGAFASYREAHEEALRLAQAAGRAHRPMDDALIAEGFACHFLTDAFSASHARTPRLSIKKHWDAKVPGFDKKLKRWLVRRIADYKWGAVKRGGAVGLPASGPVAVGVGMAVGGPIGAAVAVGGEAASAIGSAIKGASGRISEVAAEKLAILLAGGDWGFGNVVSLIVHDYEGDRGVQATIKGKPITLAGDKNLMTEFESQNFAHPEWHNRSAVVTPGRKAQATFDAAVEATRASIRDVEFAYQSGWEEKPNQVWMITPFAWTTPTRHDMSTLKDSQRLYAAEQLVPVPVDDAKLPTSQRGDFWMHNTFDELMADTRMKDALSAFGKLEWSTFADMLARSSDFPEEARAAINDALVVPLQSQNPVEIEKVLRSIIAEK